jgi:hypothetical protein
MERDANALARELLATLGAAIRDARENIVKLSQAEVGRLTRKGQPYQSEIEAGNANMTLETLVLVAAAVGLEIQVIAKPSRPSKRSSSD